MKLHPSVVEKILYLNQTLSGYEHETKLRKAIAGLDLTPYDRKASGETILVLTEDFIKELSGASQRDRS